MVFTGHFLTERPYYTFHLKTEIDSVLLQLAMPKLSPAIYTSVSKPDS
jgi:hypothetical protein